MKKNLIVALVAGFALSLASPVFANSKLKDAFVKMYAGDKADEGFKTLVTEAKCNVCHVDKEDKKKVRNPYGTALHEALEKDDFPMKEFKKEPEKFAERLNDIFKKVSEEKSGDEEHKTFAARMEAKLLPGGDKEGKGLPGKKD